MIGGGTGGAGAGVPCPWANRPLPASSLFRADAIWTTAGGRRLFGRDAIAEFTARVLPGAMRDSTATYRIEHVLFIRPDVAAVKVRQRPVTLAGEPIADATDGSPLYVNRTELHGLLGEAWAAAGNPDSARIHLGQAIRNWEGGDERARQAAARWREMLQGLGAFN